MFWHNKSESNAIQTDVVQPKETSSGSLLENFEAYLANPGKISRRSTLSKFVRGCVALSAGIAGAAFSYGTAFACSPLGNVYCCYLEQCKFCSTYDACPSGCNSNDYSWTCQEGSDLYLCGECPQCGCSYAFRLVIEAK